MSEQTMVLIGLGFTSIIVFMGLWGFFNPRSIVGFIEDWSSIAGLWLAVLLRLSFAAVLWFVAPLSRSPLVLQVLAAVIASSAVVLPLFGYTRFKAFIDWWRKLPSPVMRGWGLVAVALGCFVFWSIARPIRITLPEQQIEIRDYRTRRGPTRVQPQSSEAAARRSSWWVSG